MKLSPAGLDLIKSYEGYHAKQPDGSCKAYRCPAGVLTCGWGCTEGVKESTHWTKDEATAALAREMTKHEANVHRLVKVDLTQRQFDALVSLCYNIGAGNLAKSTLLRHLNAGDFARAASHFSDFKKARVDGALVTLPGLVKRRAKEAELFLTDARDDRMPQAVAHPETKLKTPEALVKVGGPAVAAGSVLVPAVPDAAKSALEAAQAWKGFGVQVRELGSFFAANTLLLAGIVATVAVLLIMTRQRG